MPPKIQRGVKRKPSTNLPNLPQSSILKFCKTASEVLARKNEVVLIDSDEENIELKPEKLEFSDSLFVGSDTDDENLDPKQQYIKEEIEVKSSPVEVSTLTSEVSEKIVKSEEVSISVQCPICQFTLDHLTLNDRNDHVNNCLVPPTVSASDLKPPSTADSELKSEVTRKSPPTIPKETKQRKPKRPIPGEKVLAFGELTIAVDAFCYAPHDDISIYLLTHFHADHYGGITKNWCNGSMIIVTRVTYNLLLLKYKMDPEMLFIVDFEKPTKVPGKDLMITCYEANHCPGGGIFVLESNGLRYLHCGDFRVNKIMIEKLSKYSYFDKIYLDTTYLNPLYNFPKQEVVIEQTSKFLKEKNDTYKSNQSRVIDFFNPLKSEMKANEFLICIGTYVIGKERLALNLAKELGSKIYCNDTKLEVVEQLEWPELLSTVDKNAPAFCQVHLVPLRNLNKEFLVNYLKMYSRNFKAVIGISPTGWSNKYQKPIEDLSEIVHSTDETQIYNRIEGQFERFNKGDFLCKVLNVPYSEHSSFRELFYFVNLIKHNEIIPTVNMSNNEENYRWLNLFKNFEGLTLDSF